MTDDVTRTAVLKRMGWHVLAGLCGLVLLTGLFAALYALGAVLLPVVEMLGYESTQPIHSARFDLGLLLGVLGTSGFIVLFAWYHLALDSVKQERQGHD